MREVMAYYLYNYNYNYNCEREDRQGNRYSDICSKETYVRYDEYWDDISLTLSGSIKVTHVASRENVVLFNVRSTTSDSIRYADMISQRNNLELFQELVDLLNRRRYLLSNEELVTSAIFKITKAVVNEISSNIGSDLNFPDPVKMKRYH
ncbi:MAG: hypothetical protein JKX83_11045 [Pseudomonadales bacterium]|nr:hypothetical protein [Pseudomonadales bacterium]